jgi:ribosome-associated heat shock protein Hsp15
VRDQAAASVQRIDQWLWHARLFRSRSLAADFVQSGAVRLTRQGLTARIGKPSATVRPGDQIAFLLHDRLRVIEVLMCGARRGPASEARLLYEDRSPPASAGNDGAGSPASRPKGLGRPTKKDRRDIDRLTSNR